MWFRLQLTIYLCDRVTAAVSISLCDYVIAAVSIYLWSCDSGCIYLFMFHYVLCDHYVIWVCVSISVTMCFRVCVCVSIAVTRRFRCGCVYLSLWRCVSGCVSVCIYLCDDVFLGVCIYLCHCTTTSSTDLLSRGRSRGGRGTDSAQSKTPDPLQNPLYYTSAILIRKRHWSGKWRERVWHVTGQHRQGSRFKGFH